jgi:hypothetical protein
MPAAAVIDHSLPDAARRVLEAICLFVNERGEAWPSIPLIAVHAGCSVRTVQRMLPIINAKGHLAIRQTKRGNGWSSNCYQVHYPEVDVLRVVTSKVTPPTGDTQADTTQASRPELGQSPSGDTMDDTRVVTKSPQVLSPKVAHEHPTIEQPIEQPIEEPTPRAVARPLVSDDLREKLASMKAKQEAERKAQRNRVAKLTASLMAKQEQQP